MAINIAKKGSRSRIAWRTGAAAAAVGLLAGCSSGGSDAPSGSADGVEPVTLTVATLLAEGHSLSKGFAAWASLVEEETGGQVAFDIFYDGSLCAGNEALACVEDGRADIAMVVPTYWPGEIVLNNLGNFPLISGDMQAIMQAVHTLPDEFPEIAKEYEDRNQKALFSVAADPYVLIMSEGNALDELADLDGKSIRATALNAAAISLLGANPVALGAPEMYESLERGVIQGAVYTPITTADGSLAEVAPLIYGFDPLGTSIGGSFNISLDTWNRLSEEVQTIMASAADRVVEDGTLLDVINAEIERACGQFAEAGATVSTVGDDDAGEQWRQQALDTVSADWKKNAASATSDPDAMFSRYAEMVEESQSADSKTLEEICSSVG